MKLNGIYENRVWWFQSLAENLNKCEVWAIVSAKPLKISIWKPVIPLNSSWDSAVINTICTSIKFLQFSSNQSYVVRAHDILQFWNYCWLCGKKLKYLSFSQSFCLFFYLGWLKFQFRLNVFDWPRYYHPKIIQNE